MPPRERCRTHGDAEHEQGAGHDLREQHRGAGCAGGCLHRRFEHGARQAEGQQADAEVDAEQARHPRHEALERTQGSQLRPGQPRGRHPPQDRDDDRDQHAGHGERRQQRRRVERVAVGVLDEPRLVGGGGAAGGDDGDRRRQGGARDGGGAADGGAGGVHDVLRLQEEVVEGG